MHRSVAVPVVAAWRCVLLLASGVAGLEAQPVSFLLPQYIPIGPGCCQIATGDFNRDGRMDIVVAHQAPGITVLLGNGDGTFTRKDTGQGSTPRTTINTFGAIADFNSDGIPDLLADAVTEVSDQVVILFGNGDGTFRAPVVLELGGDNNIKAVADFNGDGKPDLLVYSADDGGFAVHLGDGDGTFQPAGPQAKFPQGDFAFSVVGDFNNDGKLDVAWTTVRNSAQVFVWLGNGDGSFQKVVTSPSPVAETFKPLATGDFNHDGSLDLAIATQHYAAILLGNGDGTFRTGPTYPAPLSISPVPAQLFAADFNGDNILDLADGYMVLLGNGDGTLQPARSFGQWVNPTQSGTETYLAAADFNGDGKIDLVGAGRDGTELSILINDTPGANASVAAVSAANYGNVIAPGSLATVFGKNLTDATASAATVPLPTVLQNTKVRVLDQTGVERLAPLIYISPTQINFLVPPDTAQGSAIINVDNGKTPLVEGARATPVEAYAPGFFTADGSGHGLPAATAIRVHSDGTRTPVSIFQCPSVGACVPVPIDLSAEGTVYLSVYGTGFANAPMFSCSNATIANSGSQGQFPGLDQLNLQLPKTLPSGMVDITCQFPATISTFPQGPTPSFTISIK